MSNSTPVSVSDSNPLCNNNTLFVNDVELIIEETFVDVVPIKTVTSSADLIFQVYGLLFVSSSNNVLVLGEVPPCKLKEYSIEVSEAGKEIPSNIYSPLSGIIPVKFVEFVVNPAIAE